MIKIERDYNATAVFNEDRSTTWDCFRDKTYRVSIFGITVFKRKENLNIDYKEIETKKLGFQK